MKYLNLINLMYKCKAKMARQLLAVAIKNYQFTISWQWYLKYQVWKYLWWHPETKDIIRIQGGNESGSPPACLRHDIMSNSLKPGNMSTIYIPWKCLQLTLKQLGHFFSRCNCSFQCWFWQWSTDFISTMETDTASVAIVLIMHPCGYGLKNSAAFSC